MMHGQKNIKFHC